MKNVIKSQGRVWKRRSKNLVGGEIECVRCGHDTTIKTFKDEHFTKEFVCSTCKKELKADQPKPKPKKKKTPKKKKIGFPDDCPHRPFFHCKTASGCKGCYYNPDKKIALMKKNEDDEPKNSKEHWFYHSKKHSKECLKLLDDIKHGRGLMPGGNRHYFRYARKTEEDE